MKCVSCGVAALIALALTGTLFYLATAMNTEEGMLSAQGVIAALNRTTPVTGVQNADDNLLDGKKTVLQANDELIQIWEYRTKDAAENDAHNIEPSGSQIRTGWNSVATVDWIAPPHWYTKGRVIVLYNGENEQTKKTLTALLGDEFAGYEAVLQQQQQGGRQPLAD